jgi:hypothetical protein
VWGDLPEKELWSKRAGSENNYNEDIFVPMEC